MSAQAFEFKALTTDGAVQTGITRAATWEDAYRHVAASGLTPTSIKAASARALARGGASGGRWRRGRARIGLRDVSQFTYQLSVLLEARIPISEGLRSIAKEEPLGSALAVMIEEIAASISAGSTITDAMGRHRDVFGDVYLETVHAAEKSGNLVKILAHLAEMLDQEVERRASLRSALMYPLCVVVSLVLAVVFLMVVVVPRLVRMFGDRGMDLPVPTRMVIFASESLSHWWWAWLLALVAIAWGFGRLRATPQGRALIDRWLNKAPVIRGILQASALARFAHVFGLSLSSGLSLIECLEMSGKASGRALLLADARRMAEQVSQGGRLSEALGSCPYLTGFARRLLSAGEQSAELSGMCRIIARHYDREVKYLTKNMATLIEPMVVVVLAGVVLFLALAIFLPMWNSMALMG